MTELYGGVYCDVSGVEEEFACLCQYCRVFESYGRLWCPGTCGSWQYGYWSLIVYHISVQARGWRLTSGIWAAMLAKPAYLVS
jgi:hypothetical protein